jgi:probable F420-dependent oxidoreductase
MTQIGLQMWPTDYSASPVDVAVAAEERGFESIFVPDHTHIPTVRRTPYPEGGDLPLEYLHLLDPIAALAAMASATSRIRVGTAICLVVERDPIVLAKQVATIDHLSGGRFEFGVGGGWNQEEMANHGTVFASRWGLLRERVQAMRAIWSREEPEYHGNHVDFDPIWSWPKPVQRPGPPVLIAGSGPRALDRVLEYGDGWIPVIGWERGRLLDRVDQLRAAARERERPVPTVTVVGVNPKPDVIAELADHGVDRALVGLPVADRDEMLRRLDRYGPLVSRGRAS